MDEKTGWKCHHCSFIFEKLPEPNDEGEILCPKCECYIPRSMWKPWPPSQEEMDGSQSHVEKPFIDILFQLGPVQEVGNNGCQIEDVIDILVNRLNGFQAGPFKCRENALAITKLQEAKHWLMHRTADRRARGVEGTNEP